MAGFYPVAKGALQWIRETMSPAFAKKAEEAMHLARSTGNEHAVTLTNKNQVLGIAAGDRHSVVPNYPTRKKIFAYEDPYAVNALLHTHPVDPDFPITVAPSDADLMIPSATKGMQFIVSPEKNSFVQYRLDDYFPWERVDPLYKRLMFKTKGSMDGVEPVKPDIQLSILRRMAEEKKLPLYQNLGDETPYADELYRQLDFRQGGLVRMKGRSCGN